MKLKAKDRIAPLAALVSALAASSLLLSQGMGTARHAFLAAAAIACGALAIYAVVLWKSGRNSIG